LLYQQKRALSIKSLFEDQGRFDDYSLQWENILVDFSKNRVDKEIMSTLLDLAQELDLKLAIDAMFNGETINRTEDRAVLHTALRNRENRPVYVEGKNVMPEVNRVLQQMKDFSSRISTGEWKGYTGK